MEISLHFYIFVFEKEDNGRQAYIRTETQKHVKYPVKEYETGSHVA